jgi:hypothetical protein
MNEKAVGADFVVYRGRARCFFYACSEKGIQWIIDNKRKEDRLTDESFGCHVNVLDDVCETLIRDGMDVRNA